MCWWKTQTVNRRYTESIRGGSLEPPRILLSSRLTAACMVEQTAQFVAAAVQTALEASVPSRRLVGARAFPRPTASRCSDPASATNLILGGDKFGRAS